MKSYNWLHEHVLTHKGRDYETLLPTCMEAAELAEVPDNQLLSTMMRRIFRAGLKHELVDARWPAFETAFWQFDPVRTALMSDEVLEKQMQNSALIRHLGKLKAIRTNGAMVLEQAETHGSFARWLAEWPTDNIVGLWTELKKRGAQLGGNSGPYFLRMVGKDTFILTDDVVAALKAQGIVDKKPTSQRDLKQVQQAFNQWQEASGRPLCQISRMLSYTVGY